MSEKSFATPQPITLDLRLASGDVHVSTAAGDESTVSLEGNPKAVEAITVELAGERLEIKQRRKSLLGLFDRLDGPLHVHVTVPTESSLEMTSASADATLNGSFASLQLKSASGDLTVTGEVAGDVAAETVSGQVRLPHVSGDVTIRSVSGDLAADAVEGSVSANSVSGSVRIGSLRQGSATIRSVSGRVDLGIAQGTGVDIDAASASGKLISEIPLADAPDVDEGPTVVIRGQTVSGGFRVFRAA
jgi:hypothetical protein